MNKGFSIFSWTGTDKTIKRRAKAEYYDTMTFVLSVLETGKEFSAKELKAYLPTKLTKHRIASCLKRMRASKKNPVHITRWQLEEENNCSQWRPVYRLGAGINAVRPAALSPAERMARCRLKKKRCSK